MKRWLRLGIRLVLGGTFGIAALSKLPSEFTQPTGRKADTVYSRFISIGSATDITLIAAELLLAAWVFSGFFSVGSTVAAIVLLSVYTGVLGVEVRRPQPKPCGCLGVAGVAAVLNDAAAVRRDLWLAIGRNGLLMAGGVWLLLSISKRAPTVAPAEPAGDLIPSTT